MSGPESPVPGRGSERPGGSDYPDPSDPRAGASAPLDCAEALTRVYLYLDGEIDAPTSAGARAHLEECVPCLREYGLEEEVKRLVRRSCGCDEVPSGLRDRVLVRLHQVTITLRHE